MSIALAWCDFKTYVEAIGPGRGQPRRRPAVSTGRWGGGEARAVCAPRLPALLGAASPWRHPETGDRARLTGFAMDDRDESKQGTLQRSGTFSGPEGRGC